MSEVDLTTRIRGFLKSALTNLESRRYDRALADLMAAEGLDRDNPEVLYNLGVACCRSGDYRRSISYFRRVLDLPFTFVDVITVNKLLAFAQIQLGETEPAARDIANILKLSPDDVTLLNMLGYCHERAQRYREALAAYNRIIEIDRHNYNAYNSLAYIIATLNGDLNRALKFAKTALDASPENPAYLDTIGFVYMKKGNPDLARKNFKKALSKLPDSAEIREHLNQLLELEG
ncbi:MAG TPA: tetratricopeptide repeat protein [Spirochaetota bacterium]|nr:tetratricopeptide repeat protein [Spirochaetota bacterium]HOS39572.1 tetratricopeptide repeat protein [Spirochaetota bacterium]HPI21653.1 tetratricopeptide repeat protein [Spirochaetota bacterium]HPU88432.1 tetratricopeptide repeat protein [Spirochaetota bacterium]